MIDLVTGIATVPAIVALVNLSKTLGLPAKGALALAVVLGVALNLATYAWADYAWFTAASSGLILGLGAAGLYDLTPGPAPKRAAVEPYTLGDEVNPLLKRDERTKPPF